jgi:hypothetical protein
MTATTGCSKPWGHPSAWYFPITFRPGWSDLDETIVHDLVNRAGMIRDLDPAIALVVIFFTDGLAVGAIIRSVGAPRLSTSANP